MTNWNKHTYVCGNCDSLIEITTTHNDLETWCVCAEPEAILLSVEPATIAPTNERKEMETTTDYNANALVTYKDITDGVVTYPTLKVNELEYKLENTKNIMRRIEAQEKQIGMILNNLTVDGWYSDSTEKSEVLADLCEILGHEAKEDITIRATVTVDVTYACPLDELEDFDAKYFLQDILTVDAYNGDVIIDSFDVEDADVEY